MFDFLAGAPDHVLLHAYLSQHPEHSQEDSTRSESIIAMKDILERQDNKGRTALHLAVARRDVAVVGVLPGYGASPSAVDTRLHTPLHLACADDPDSPDWYLFWSFNARGAIVELLLSHGAPVNALNVLGQTPLLMTCSNTGSHPRADGTPHPPSNETNFDLEVLNTVDSLLKHGADPTMGDSRGSYPLHEACRTTSVNPPTKLEMVNKLLDHQSPVNAAARGDETPLHAACSCPEVEVVTELLRRGADPTLRDHKGRSPLHTAVVESTDEVVGALLSSPDVSVDATDDTGATPLHMACDGNPTNGRAVWVHRRLPIIRQLLEHGARAYTVRNHDGDSPADIATKHGVEGALTLLVTKGCDAPPQQ